MIGQFFHHRPPAALLRKHLLLDKVQLLKTTKSGTLFQYQGGEAPWENCLIIQIISDQKISYPFFSYYFGGSDLGGSGCCSPTAGILNDYFGADRHGVGPPPTAQSLTRPNDRWPLWNLCILSIPPTNCRLIRPPVGFIPRLIPAPLRGKCK